jgi:hypothetical protein
MNVMTKLRILVLAAVLALLAGCGTHQSHVKATNDALARMNLVSFMRATFSADYDPVASPDALSNQADITVEGHVVSVEDGRAVSIAGDVPDHHVTIAIAVDRSISDDPDRVGDLVYIELPRPDNVNADIIGSKLPEGTKLFLMGFRVNEQEGDVQNRYGGREPGATLYQPAVQGLFIQSEDQAFEGVLEPLSDMSTAWQSIDSMGEMTDATQGG